MDTPNNPAKPCPGPTKSSRSRVESLREKRERLREEMRKASAQLAEAESKAEKLARIQARQVELQEQMQMATLSKAVGLHRYRLSTDDIDAESFAPLDVNLLGGALSWLAKRMTMMSEEDKDVMREEGAALNKEMQEKKDASRKKADHNKSGSTSSPIKSPATFNTA